MNPLDRLGLEAAFPRILAILAFVALTHLLVRAGYRATRSFLERPSGPGERPEPLARRYPTAATLLSLFHSALIFLVYLLGVGWIFAEFGVSLTGYLATASVIGLAVAFGSQGLVQDVVIGLTLLFTDVLDVGDTVEISGQIGRVEAVGLRFTTLVNFQGQRVFVPNRNITLVGRYHRGCIRAYADVQVPPGVEVEGVREAVRRVAEAVHGQFASALLTPPEELGVSDPGPDGWRYVRTKFRLWPGQNQVVESVFRQRLLHVLRELDAGYAEWMVTVTYRVPAGPLAGPRPSPAA